MTITAQLRPARRTWGDLAAMVELAAGPGAVALSAETGRLAVTPAPYGKPGGPGLYGVAGNSHSPYYEQLVKALRKRGMDKGKASAIAWGALRKWSRGGGHVHPEVRAAATGALALEKVAQARAHAHARTWDEVGALIDLAWIAHPTAAQYAVIDARTGHAWWKDGDGGKAPAKVTASALVAHQDGSVTGGAGKVKVGSLSHEGGKWVAHHGDGTVTKHASRPVALKAMAARHNARVAKPAPAAPRPAAAAPTAPPVAAKVPGGPKAPAKVTAASLVVHQDGSVAHKQTGAKVGSLSHEGGKWVARHADGTVSKHAGRQAAVLAIAARHNKAAAPPAKAPVPPAGKAALSGDAAFSSVRRPGNLTAAEKGALAEYGEPDGYKTTNPYLFHDGQVFDSSVMKYRPATPAETKLAKTVISGMDSAFAKAAPLKQDIVTYRRMGDTDAMFGKGSAVGKTVRNQAYTSTTTKAGAQTGYGFGYSSKSGNIEVHVPAGSKVMPGNDFEHELLLPRGAAFRVTSDETTPGGQRNIVMTYDPAAAGEPGAEAVAVPVVKEAAKTVPPVAVKPAAVKAPESPAPAAKAADAGKPPDAAAAGLVDSMNDYGAFGGKSAQKTILKKHSLADLQGMDAEYGRRGTASGKILAAHQLVKDEIASRGATPLPAPSPAVMKEAHTAARVKAATGPASKQDLISAWSTSYRYKGTTEANDKRVAAFAVEMHRMLATNKQPDKCGPGCQDAHKFLAMVDKEATVQPGELQRGLTLSSAAAERMFKPGKTMDMPAASWTADAETGASYLRSTDKNGNETPTPAGKVKVLIHAAPGAKGMDITAESIWHGENETVTGGRFNVDKVQTANGVMNVYVTQQAFSAN